MSMSSDISRRDDAAPAERTQSGPVFTPPVDIFENQTALVLMADMPGVAKDDLDIRLDNDVLTIQGRSLPGAGLEGEPLLSEFEAGLYFRQFTLSEAIDRAKIEAKLNGGVLKLVLPKAEAAVPRRIEVSPG